MADLKARAVELLAILHNDRPLLRRFDGYVEGIQDNPYMPKNADDEYKLLAERAKTSVIPLLVGAPVRDGLDRDRDRQESAYVSTRVSARSLPTSTVAISSSRSLHR
ncbi:hypothetical protein ACFVWG_10320 [Kribbella sp. NPDC058245]|uniref:hypothetical protein n=1 Tax=Kribbella sp. NPDC058245 TaxID=3346399 RepID=UPI0036E4140F